MQTSAEYKSAQFEILPPSAERYEGEYGFTIELRQRKEKAPKITKKRILGLGEILQREQTDIKGLEEKIRATMADFNETMAKSSSVEEDYLPFFETLYNLFQYQKNHKNLPHDLKWLSNCANLEDFCNYFCPNINPHSKAYIKKTVLMFVEQTIHPQRTIFATERMRQMLEDPNSLEYYQGQGDWLLMPKTYMFSDSYDFAEKSVVSEIVELLEQGCKDPDWSHVTGSSALPGIGLHLCVYSARNAAEKEQRIQTGEHTDYVTEEGVPVAGGRYGLSSVYAHAGGPRYGYHVLNWFDDFYVSCGINKENQMRFLRNIGHKFDFGTDKEKLIIDNWDGEGVRIGPMVPLGSVETIYCWKMYEQQMRDWIKQFCPHVKVISYEAADLLSRYNRKIKEISAQEEISESDVWRKILEQ